MDWGSFGGNSGVFVIIFLLSIFQFVFWIVFQFHQLNSSTILSKKKKNQLPLTKKSLINYILWSYFLCDLNPSSNCIRPIILEIHFCLGIIDWQYQFFFFFFSFSQMKTRGLNLWSLTNAWGQSTIGPKVIGIMVE